MKSMSLFEDDFFISLAAGPLQTDEQGKLTLSKIRSDFQSKSSKFLLSLRGI